VPFYWGLGEGGAEVTVTAGARSPGVRDACRPVTFLKISLRRGRMNEKR
jgi:hypothetical protein